MSELLLPPEHRYAKIIAESRNDDGSEYSILNLGPTHPATHGIFQKLPMFYTKKRKALEKNSFPNKLGIKCFPIIPTFLLPEWRLMRTQHPDPH